MHRGAELNRSLRMDRAFREGVEKRARFDGPSGVRPLFLFAAVYVYFTVLDQIETI